MNMGRDQITLMELTPTVKLIIYYLDYLCKIL